MQAYDPNQQKETSESSDRPKIDIVRPAPRQPKAPRPSVWHLLRPVAGGVAFVFGVIVTAMFINAFVFQSYYVEGSSMSPTLHDDDRLIIDKVGHSVANFSRQPYMPQRGDIVVLNSELPDPNTPGGYEQLIKRVIGLPGERVLVEDGAVRVFNAEYPEGLDADSTLDLQLAPTFSAGRIDQRLGDGEVFVIGDNRAPGGSLDSRSFGPVRADSIEGRLSVRVFPFSDISVF